MPFFLPEGVKSIVIDNPTWVPWDKEWAVFPSKEGCWMENHNRCWLHPIGELYKKLRNVYHLAYYGHSRSKWCAIRMSHLLLRPLEWGLSGTLPCNCGRPRSNWSRALSCTWTETQNIRSLPPVQQCCSALKSLPSIAFEFLFLAYMNVENGLQPLSLTLTLLWRILNDPSWSFKKSLSFF